MELTPQQPDGAQRPSGIAQIEERVRTYLNWDTLETRRRDALDFHEVSVERMRNVIRMAFDAGAAYAAGTRAAPYAVLKTAERALAARQADMLTLEEWLNLARAVAAATGRTTAGLLTQRDLEDFADDYPGEWNEAVDGPLPKLD